MAKLKKRSEIPEKYKWDLTMLVKDEQEFLEIYHKLEEDLKKIQSYKGNLFKSGKTLLEYSKLSSLMEEDLTKLYIYANLYKYEDLVNSKANDYVLKILNLNNLIATSTSWVSAELSSHEEQEFDILLKEEPLLEEYAHLYHNIFRNKAHILSAEEENIISKLLKSYGKTNDTFEILNDAEGFLGYVTINKEKVLLTQNNYTHLMQNTDRNIRKKVFKTYYKFYENHKNTFASLYATNVIEDNALSLIRKFPNSLAMALDSENIDPVVYDNLLKSVNKHLNIAYTYQEIKKDILGLKDYHIYDNYVELKPKKKEDYPISKSQEILLQALKPLENDYLEKLKFMFNSKYIDYYPNQNKKSGAYQWKRYVSLNHLDNYDSLTTMAHELGHAINTLYTEESCPIEYQENPIFLAEIASTLNEVLLNEYLISHAKTKEEKQAYLMDFLSRVHATIYRQTMFAEFEYLVHLDEQNNVSLTEENMSKTYLNLIKKYFTKKMTIDEEIKYEWMRIPHFYNSFYVYKYAIGLICALIFAKRILNKETNAVLSYLEFLKSGSKDYPLNILKKAGIDLTKEETFEEAFSLIDTKIHEWKDVIKDE